MATPRIGRLPPRYVFLLNPHVELRLTRCPGCNKPTYPRKFALAIVISGCMPYMQGKTCKYCPRCEMIICDQAELEAEMAASALHHWPDSLGRDYLIFATLPIKAFN